MSKTICSLCGFLLLLGLAGGAQAQGTVPPSAATDTTVVTAAPPPAPPSSPPQPFEKGHWRGGLFAGYGSSSGDDYFILGGSISRLIARGLDVGVDFETWLGSDPGLSKISPQARYILLMAPRTMPYVGAFYRRTFVSDGFDDWNSLGGRAGIYQQASRNTMLGVGVVYEKYLDCDGDCDDVYPEASISLFF
jgi:hypothetical protein